jgi:hypothetical protein
MQENNDCDHYENRGYYADTINDWTGEEEREWVDDSRSLQVDLDLHRFRCTRCKQIGYYSGAGKHIMKRVSVRLVLWDWTTELSLVC